MIDRILGLGLLIAAGAVTCAVISSCLVAGYLVGIITVFIGAVIVMAALGTD